MILEKFKLNGKTAIVTGCSRGLGQGIAKALAEAGANIVGVYNSGNPQTIASYIKLIKGSFLGIQADLTLSDPIPGIVEQAVDRFGEIDILVNNSGIVRRQDSAKYKEKDWNDILDLNLKSVFFFCQAVGKHFIDNKKPGKIINIASLLSYQGGIRVPAYTASKHGVLGITQALANEWAKFGITVNAIAPGYMDTDNTKDLKEDKERNKAILERIPAGRWGTPFDLAGASVFLASSASDYVNGFTLAVDGGWLGR